MSEEKQVQVVELKTLPQVTAVTPMQLLSVAVSQGADIDKLEKLMALQERWEASNARKAFDAAISAARAEIKPIIKTGHVKYNNTDYKHETLDGIAQAIDPILGKNGLSYRFRSSQEGAVLCVTCILAHSGGHSEETALRGSPDTSGQKNAYQAIGSAATYLQRYTLKLALGLSAAKDDDAKSADVSDEPDITDWLTVIGDSTTLYELKKNYTEAYNEIKAHKAAIAAGDTMHELLKELGPRA